MNISRQLSELHQRKHVLPAGNATAGLCLALKALGVEGKKVAIPASVCVNVPLAVLLSGNEPVFFDIDPKDFGISVEALRQSQERVDCVLAVHAYGSMCRIEELAALCKEKGLPLIEDFAVAQGARLQDRPAGSFGDASVVSFGAGKIVSCGGGAVLTDDKALFSELERHDGLLPDFTQEKHDGVGALMREFKISYNSWLGKDLNGFWKEFRRSALAAGPHFLHRYSPQWDAPIAAGLSGLDENLKGRARRAERLRRSLKSELIEAVAAPEGSVYWRFNLRVRRGRNELLKRLLRKKLPVSSWHAPADLFYRDRKERRTDLTRSDALGAELLNLWVDEAAGEDYLVSVSREINDFCSSLKQEVTP
ncbi:MAG: DegT/DnrJ/EryC1/StrS family aminotransferase [Elusimicrobia bacterium]|nr:DegT/DnrJ/EryC1/StrS family aminotransferase [Elusimicrobiota bacterium]